MGDYDEKELLEMADLKDLVEGISVENEAAEMSQKDDPYDFMTYLYSDKSWAGYLN